MHVSIYAAPISNLYSTYSVTEHANVMQTLAAAVGTGMLNIQTSSSGL